MHISKELNNLINYNVKLIQELEDSRIISYLSKFIKKNKILSNKLDLTTKKNNDRS